METTKTSQEAGLSDSWEGLPEAEPVAELPEPIAQTPDQVDASDLPKGHCQACGDFIVREPGARGRAPKYHPDCRPLRAATSASASSKSGRASKAEAEADQVIVWFQQRVTQAAIMISVVDRFDAFCVMASLPGFSESLKGVLVKYDWMRRDMLAAKTGGSLFGLALSGLMMLLPMAAHHGLLGKGQAAQMLMQMPFTLLRLHERLKEGSEALTKMMAEQLQKAAEANRQREQANASADVSENVGI